MTQPDNSTVTNLFADTTGAGLGLRVAVTIAALCVSVVLAFCRPHMAPAAPGDGGGLPPAGSMAAPAAPGDSDPLRQPDTGSMAASAAPGDLDQMRLPDAQDLAAQLGLSPDELADLIPTWDPDSGTFGGLPDVERAPASPSAFSPASAAEAVPPSVYLPLALHRSGPLAPPVAPTPSITPAVSPTPTIPADPSAAMFDAATILDVEIEIDPEDWDALRVQARTLAEIFSTEECMNEPHESPFTYFPADVWVNGDLIPNVGVRKKGFLGSISSTKPSLKIRFDKYVDRPRYAGLNRLTLNNAKQDRSYLRQCLTYGLFARAGLPAPRCSYARVKVNGENLGIYAHIESIKKPFLEREFGDDSGNLYEGALSDLTADWVKTFERKTNESDPDRSDLAALVTALEADDEELLDALEPVLDVGAFIDFWAMEVLTGHWDGYANNRNNFFLYRDPGSNLFTFVPWGTDGAFVDNARAPADGGPPLVSVTATAHLPRRLYLHPEGRELYFTRLEALLDDVWDEERLLAEMSRTVELIEPELDSSLVAGFRQDVAAIRYLIVTRRGRIEAELRDGRPDREFAPSGPPCRQAIGHFSGSFAVRWDQPGVITATATIQLAGTELDLVQVGAAAGVSGDDPWPTHAAIQVAGLVAEDTPPIGQAGDVFVVILFVDPDQLGADRVIAVDGHNAFGWAALSRPQRDGSRQVVLVGMPWVGDLTLDQAGTTPGDLVSGSVDVDIVMWGGL